MASPKAKAPARRYHISGQSVVTLGGRDFNLGPHDSLESIARYAVLIGIYQQNGLKLSVELVDVSTVGRLRSLEPLRYGCVRRESRHGNQTRCESQEYWRMSRTPALRYAMTNRCPTQQGLLLLELALVRVIFSSRSRLVRTRMLGGVEAAVSNGGGYPISTFIPPKEPKRRHVWQFSR